MNDQTEPSFLPGSHYSRYTVYIYMPQDKAAGRENVYSSLFIVLIIREKLFSLSLTE